MSKPHMNDNVSVLRCLSQDIDTVAVRLPDGSNLCLTVYISTGEVKDARVIV